MDIPAMVPCMPGAELTEKVDDRTYKGKVSVRLGPVALSFAGTATFEEVDDAAHKARIKAQGTDAKGRGGANSLVNFSLAPSGTGSKVTIDTDLNLSGSVAQYGRGAGMIQSVANQLVSQFAKSLEAQIAASSSAAAPSSLASGPGTAAPAGGGPSDMADVGQTTRPGGAKPARPVPAAKPIGGFSLLLNALWASLTGLFRRLFRRGE